MTCVVIGRIVASSFAEILRVNYIGKMHDYLFTRVNIVSTHCPKKDKTRLDVEKERVSSASVSFHVFA